MQLYIKSLEELHYLKGLLSMQPCFHPTDEAYELIHRVNSLIMEKGPHTAPCLHCGESMQKDKNNKNRLYCSGRCRVAAHRKKRDRK